METQLIDRSKARSALAEAQCTASGRLALREMRHMLKAMLEEAHIMAMATGSIGGSTMETVGDLELEVSFYWRRKGQKHDICRDPKTACPLCRGA